MAAVDLNVLVGALVVLSVLAYIFVMRRVKTKQPKQTDNAITTVVEDKPAVSETEISKDHESEKPPERKSAAGCVHHFGYLSNRPKKSRIPKECLECNKMTKCLGKRKPKKPSHKRIETQLAVDEVNKVLTEP